MTLYTWRCTQDQKDFEKAFGADWKAQLPPEQAKKMVKKRWSFFLKIEASSEIIWECDIPFWTIPGSKEELLCDVWRPGNGDVSGLAFIYFHDGGWTAGE